MDTTNTEQETPSSSRETPKHDEIQFRLKNAPLGHPAQELSQFQERSNLQEKKTAKQDADGPQVAQTGEVNEATKRGIEEI